MTHIENLTKSFGLDKLNTMTKYPSILTYHATAERGSLAQEKSEGKTFKGLGKVYVTEKIDGTNSRMVFTTNEEGAVEDYILGSREDFLYACGDRIINPALGLVATLEKHLVPKFNLPKIMLGHEILKPNYFYIVYGETYGGKINNAKQYTKRQNYFFRAFDLVAMPIEEAKGFLSMKVEDISSWREHGGQPFVPVSDFIEFCDTFQITRVPYILTMDGDEIGMTPHSVLLWMNDFIKSTATIDEDYDGLGQSEGVVVRTEKRDLIRKFRFEDYQKTARMHPEWF